MKHARTCATVLLLVVSLFLAACTSPVTSQTPNQASSETSQPKVKSFEVIYLQGWGCDNRQAPTSAVLQPQVSITTYSGIYHIAVTFFDDREMKYKTQIFRVSDEGNYELMPLC